MKLILGSILAFNLLIGMAYPERDMDTEYLEETTVLPNENSEENGEKGDMEKCDETMARNGLNFSSFWQGAGHGIHSLSLEEIRHYFEPDAPEENRIPVVNTNLTAEKTILFNAPLRGYDDDFKTMALKVMAYFMLNDKPYFFEQGVNTLEKVTHQYHMHEIYAAAAPIYRKLKDDPPSDPELCPCVNDVTGNGILEQMVRIAKQLKYFARQPRQQCRSGRPPCLPLRRSYRPSSRRYRPSPSSRRYRPSSRSYRRKRDVTNQTEIIKQLEEQYLEDSSKENAWKLMSLKPWKANTFTGPEQWVSYEASLTWSMLSDEELNDFAMFIYCKLNQPGLDHTKDLFD